MALQLLGTIRALKRTNIAISNKLWLFQLVLIFLLIEKEGFAQGVNSKGVYIKLNEINAHLIKNYKVDHGYLDNICINTIVILKFKIIAKRIDAVEFTKSVPAPIKQALENALHLDSGEILLTNGDEFEKKTILIPILFNYTANCKTPLSLVSVDSNGVVKASKSLLEQSFPLAFKNMLNLENGDPLPLECILLPPVVFTSMN
jgi:hypothetical protein